MGLDEKSLKNIDLYHFLHKYDDDDDDILFMLSNIIKYMQCTLSKA